MKCWDRLHKEVVDALPLEMFKVGIRCGFEQLGLVETVPAYGRMVELEDI